MTRTNKETTYTRMQLIELALQYNKVLKRSGLLQLTGFFDWLKEREIAAQQPKIAPGQMSVEEKIQEVDHHE